MILKTVKGLVWFGLVWFGSGVSVRLMVYLIQRFGYFIQILKYKNA